MGERKREKEGKRDGVRSEGSGEGLKLVHVPVLGLSSDSESSS